MQQKPIEDYPHNIQALVATMLQRAEDDKGRPDQRAGMAQVIQEIFDLMLAAERERCAKLCEDEANDERGLSAGRSMDHYSAWTWLAGDDLGDLLSVRKQARFSGVRSNRKFGFTVNEAMKNEGKRRHEHRSILGRFERRSCQCAGCQHAWRH